MKWATRASIVSVAMLTLLGSTGAQAGEFGIDGGAFGPSTGHIGWTVGAQYLAGERGDALLLGAEIEYRDYATNVLGVMDADSQDILLNGIARYRFFPEKWTPYVGLGFGLGVNILEKSKIKDQLPVGYTYSFNKVGFLMGMMGVIGVEGPIGSHFSWFLEGGGNLYARIDSDGSDTTFRNFSGWNARSGFRRRF